MPLDPGDLDRVILIERDAPGRSALGNDVAGWATLAMRWAHVVYGSGMERRQAAADAASQTATFEVRRDTVTETVTPADRISLDGLLWNITNVARLGRDFMALTATAQQPGGGI